MLLTGKDILGFSDSSMLLFLTGFFDFRDLTLKFFAGLRFWVVPKEVLEKMLTWLGWYAATMLVDIKFFLDAFETFLTFFTFMFINYL